MIGKAKSPLLNPNKGVAKKQLFWTYILDANSKTTKRIGGKVIKEDIRGYCNRNCIYSDNGRCDIWDNFAMPEEIDKCNNYTENF